MDDVVILVGLGRFQSAVNEQCGVFDSCNVVRREVEVFAGELVDDGVNLDNGGFNPMSDESSRCSADSKSTETRLA